MSRRTRGRAKEETAQGADLITVKDLAEEFGVEGRVVRQFIRGLGMKAPEIENREGFGPKSKYEWPSDSEDLATIREKWAEREAAAAKDGEDD